MKRGGQPYVVKGAGGTEKLEALAARGANSIRTWGTENLDQILEAAASHQLTVSTGIWLEPECNWFSYHKPEDCAKQAAKVKAAVLLYRNHPSLLAWGLGVLAGASSANVIAGRRAVAGRVTSVILMGLAAYTMVTITHPVWFMVVATLGALGAAALADRTFGRPRV
jgi:hypothetical protein